MNFKLIHFTLGDYIHVTLINSTSMAVKQESFVNPQ